MAKSKYPRTLYKADPNGTQRLTTGGVSYYYDSLVVNNEAEQDTAEDMGYIDSFHDALFHKPSVEAEPLVKEEF